MKVEIMSREVLSERGKRPFPQGTAIISITDSQGEDVYLEHPPQKILRLKFDDVSDEIFETLLGRKPSVGEMRQISQRFHMVSNLQIQQMGEFIRGLAQGDTLICQCEYGQSRSAAVAAAVLEYYRGKGICIFADARYFPNKLVYRKLLQFLRTQGKCEQFFNGFEV